MDCDGKSESSPEREAADDEAKGLEGADGVKKRKRRPYRPGKAPALGACSHPTSVAPRAVSVEGAGCSCGVGVTHSCSATGSKSRVCDRRPERLNVLFRRHVL